MHRDMERFVPKKSGELRASGHIRDGRTSGVSKGTHAIVYRKPYAKSQFYGSNGRATWTKGKMPGTGPRWDLKANDLYMGKWKQTYYEESWQTLAKTLGYKAPYKKGTDPAYLMNLYAGRGKIWLNDSNGWHRNFETVDTGKFIGYVADKDGEPIKTTKIRLVYSKSGVHLFPEKP